MRILSRLGTPGTGRKAPQTDFSDSGEVPASDQVTIPAIVNDRVIGKSSDTPTINHNVYILGAGFSVDGGIPVVKDFLERMADSVDWLESQKRSREAEAIRKVFEFRLRAAGAAYRTHIDVENVEELFSLASASEGEAAADHLTLAIAATIDVARLTTTPLECVIEEKVVIDNGGKWERRDVKHPIYRLYAGIMTSSLGGNAANETNTIITFNYDTLLEDSLSELRIPFHYGLPISHTLYHDSSKCLPEADGKAVPIYKLHGSVNWSKPPLWGMKMSVYGDYEEQRKRGAGTLLIPPTWRKEFAGQLTHVWEKAVSELETATRIIVIGFSMPPTDNHFKYLLAAGLQRNISLRKFLFVNPGLKDEEEEARLRANLFNILREELEKKGLVLLADIATHEFLLSRANLALINRTYPTDYLGITYPGRDLFQIYH